MATMQVQGLDVEVPFETSRLLWRLQAASACGDFPNPEPNGITDRLLRRMECQLHLTGH